MSATQKSFVDQITASPAALAEYVGTRWQLTPDDAIPSEHLRYAPHQLQKKVMILRLNRILSRKCVDEAVGDLLSAGLSGEVLAYVVTNWMMPQLSQWVKNEFLQGAGVFFFFLSKILLRTPVEIQRQAELQVLQVVRTCPDLKTLCGWVWRLNKLNFTSGVYINEVAATAIKHLSAPIKNCPARGMISLFNLAKNGELSQENRAKLAKIAEAIFLVKNIKDLRDEKHFQHGLLRESSIQVLCLFLPSYSLERQRSILDECFSRTSILPVNMSSVFESLEFVFDKLTDDIKYYVLLHVSQYFDNYYFETTSVGPNYQDYVSMRNGLPENVKFYFVLDDSNLARRELVERIQAKVFSAVVDKKATEVVIHLTPEIYCELSSEVRRKMFNFICADLRKRAVDRDNDYWGKILVNLVLAEMKNKAVDDSTVKQAVSIVVELRMWNALASFAECLPGKYRPSILILMLNAQKSVPKYPGEEKYYLSNLGRLAPLGGVDYWESCFSLLIEALKKSSANERSKYWSLCFEMLHRYVSLLNDVNACLKLLRDKLPILRTDGRPDHENMRFILAVFQRVDQLMKKQQNQVDAKQAFAVIRGGLPAEMRDARRSDPRLWGAHGNMPAAAGAGMGVAAGAAAGAGAGALEAQAARFASAKK